VASSQTWVIDTNVWLMADKDIDAINVIDELNCSHACQNWLSGFRDGDELLVVDSQYQIFKEYRRKIKKGGLAEQILNQLETQPRDLRLIEVQIVYDSEGYAILPSIGSSIDSSDRKFVAVVLGVPSPKPPIVNATDTDWAKADAALSHLGVVLLEICPTYIRTHLKNG